MILSQLTVIRTPMGKTTEDRFDVDIMLWVGQTGMRRMRGSGRFAKLKAQNVQAPGAAESVPSGDLVVVEPPTSATHKLFLKRDGATSILSSTG